MRQKINERSVLVLNLVEISIEFLVFIDLQIPKVLGLLPFRARLLLLNKHFVPCLRVTCAREISHLHDDYILLLLPEFFRVLLSCAN